VNGYRRRDANLKGTNMAERISFQELEDKLRDIDTPDEELVPYFTGNPEASKPFQPILKPNPATVKTTRRRAPARIDLPRASTCRRQRMVRGSSLSPGRADASLRSPPGRRGATSLVANLAAFCGSRVHLAF
jgi:hypothetical protein